ncbi:MAG TPA: zf-HC2 domain-containing protein [Nocardioides sp.]
MTCSMEIELGAYVLHALEPDETDAVQEHLGDCDTCRDEVRSLAFTASLLALLTPQDLDEFDEIRRTPVSTRRRTRPRVAMVVVAAVLGIGVVFGGARMLNHQQPPAATVVQAVDPATHVKASVAMAPGDSGTRLQLSLAGAYPRGWCALVARSRDGTSDTAATWVADADGTASVSGMTAIHASRLSELDVVTDTGRVLVRIPVHDKAT